MAHVLDLDDDPIGCVATILGVLLFPEVRRPLPIMEQQEIYAYVTRLKTQNDPEWAGEVQRLRPGFAIVPDDRLTYWEAKYHDRLTKALRVGFAAAEFLDPSTTAPGQAPKTVNELGEKYAAAFGMTASNFLTRAWRPWAPASAACVAYRELHLQLEKAGAPEALPLWLLRDPDNVRAFVELAGRFEPLAIAHPKIRTSDQNCLRLRIAE